MQIKQIFGSLFLVLIVSAGAFADQEVTRGRLLLDFKDISFYGGLEPAIERSYNSRSNFKGIFGMGWGSQYEVYLTVTGYGPVIVHQDGVGPRDFLFPDKWTAGSTAEMIVDASKKSQPQMSPEEASKLKQKLLRDFDFLDQEWNKYAAKGLLTRNELAVGAKVSTSMYGYKELTRVPGGYILKVGENYVETFNDNLRLKRIEDANENYIEFTLDENGNYPMIKDNFDRELIFTYNDKHLVTKIVGRRPQAADIVNVYSYSPKGELVLSKDAEGKELKYEYNENSRISKVSSPDQKTVEVTYYGLENRQRVKTFKDQDGSLTTFEYPPFPPDADNSIVEELRTQNDKTTSKARYEYSDRSKPTAERWLSKKIETIAGDVTESEYDEHCGCPLTIKKPQGVTRFQYDEKGRVLRKESPTETVVWVIDGASGRVASVERYPKGKPDKAVSATFAYDQKGNMKWADSERKRVTLTRDRYGRISELVTSAKKQIEFKYNNDSKPIEITVVGVGTLKVTHDERGDIKGTTFEPAKKRVEGASQIIVALDELATITKLTNVDLSF